MKSWHIRMAITSFCNYECSYCSKNHPNIYLSLDEIRRILLSAYSLGIKRVHWTGGEPTCHPQFLDCVREAQKIGFEEQIVSTNGSSVGENLRALCNSPIDRFNVSLDTLNPELYEKLTGKKYLKRVLSHVECIVNTGKLVKINCVVMKDNLEEIPDMIKFFSAFNTAENQKVILRLIQFYPSNPNQLGLEGKTFWKNQYISNEEIMKRMGDFCESKSHVVGDNPSFKYYNIKGFPIQVGLLCMFSWDYVCGECLKLRITPFGGASVCLQDEKIFNLKGLDFEETRKVIHEAMNRRQNILSTQTRKHFRPQLGMLRFGANGNSADIIDFKKIID